MYSGLSSIFLVCIWCSLDAGGLLSVIRAQPMLTAEILTPRDDRKEGGQVQVRCTATDFDVSNVAVEWKKDNIDLRRGDDTVTPDARYAFETTRQLNKIIQEFTIKDLHKNDTGEYVCNVIYTRATTGGNVLATVRTSLSVLYFPSEFFPICSPAGPTTVATGTPLSVRCSSASGNPQVEMAILQGGHFIHKYTWSSSSTDDTVLRSLDVTVELSDDKVQFVCTISSSSHFPDLIKSCFIGPLNVTEATELSTNYTPSKRPSSSNSAAIAGAVIGGAASLIAVFILIVICQRKLGICVCHINRLSKHCQPKTTLNELTQPQPVNSEINHYENVGFQIDDQYSR